MDDLGSPGAVGGDGAWAFGAGLPRYRPDRRPIAGPGTAGGNSRDEGCGGKIFFRKRRLEPPMASFSHREPAVRRVVYPIVKCLSSGRRVLP
jgi:hypothetical protein